MNRRQFLAGTGLAVIGTLGAALPAAHSDVALDATVDVTDVRWVPVDEPEHDREVDGLTFVLESTADHTIEPVPFLWGQYNWMMQSWEIVDGRSTLGPGERATYRVVAPSPSPRLYPDQRAQLSVYDKGTEARTQTQFTPSDIK